MGLVGDHHYVVPFRQHRHSLAPLWRDELVDQREHIPVVLAQKFAQMSRRLGVDPLAGGDHPAIGEIPVQLIVELGPVGNHHKRPVARLLAQNLLCEPKHRQRLARSLRVPKNPQPALPPAHLPQRVQRIVHPQELVILSQRLHQPARPLHERYEVPHQIQ